MAFHPPTPSSLPPSGAAGGDLGGTYPNPTVLSLANVSNATLNVKENIFATDAEALLVGKAGDTGDVFAVGTVTPQIAFSSTGTLQRSVVLSGTTITPDVIVAGNAGTRWYQLTYSDTASSAAVWTSLKARGTQTSPAVVQSGDRLAAVIHAGYDGVSSFRNSTGVLYEIDAGTYSATSMPGRQKLLTAADGSTTLTERLGVYNLGNVKFTVGSNTVNLTASTEFISYDFNAGSSTLTFATTAPDLQRSVVFRQHTLAVSAADSMDLAIGTQFVGAPIAGTNLTIGGQINTITGDISNGNNYAASFAIQSVIVSPGIANGIGAADGRVGLQITGLLNGGQVSLGNQTNTLSELYGILVEAVEFTSTTNTRTVTEAYGAYINAPVASTNVTFTNSGALKLSGDLKMASGYMEATAATDIEASTTQSQGQGQLTNAYNKVTVVANNDDVVTLPKCAIGRSVVIQQSTGNQLQVFPYVGDDAGSGVNNSFQFTGTALLYGVTDTLWIRLNVS